MDKDVQKFFELFIGYDGKKWDESIAKKHLPNVSSYFLHDMERMIKEQVGYPSVLYLLNIIAFLGYCIKHDTSWDVPSEAKKKQEEFKKVGKKDDFEYFCKNYLAKANDNYKNEDFINFLFELIRHRLSHSFFVHNFITTFSDDRHLQIQNKGSNYPYIWLSVSDFFKDTKKAIEIIYRDLEKDEILTQQFAKKQKFILDWTWKLQAGTLKKIEQDNKKNSFSNHTISNNKNVSGSGYGLPK